MPPPRHAITKWSIIRASSSAPLLSGCLFLAAALLGLVLSRDTDGVTALWPANAILLSALTLASRPVRRWHLAACAIAGFIANWMSGAGFGLAVVFALANVAAAQLAFVMTGNRRGPGRSFESPAYLLRFVRAVACGAAAGATIGGLGLWIATGSFVASWVSWATSDFLGMLLITPLVALALGRLRAATGVERRAMVGWRLWPLVGVLIASVLVFQQSRFPLLFMPMAAVMVATYALGLLGAAGGTLIVAAVGSAMMATGHGPSALVVGSVALRVGFFQSYLATLYATAMPLATLLAERARLARERADSDRRHQRIVERSSEIIFETDLAGNWTYLNPAWEALTGRSVADSIGASMLDALIEVDRSRALACLEPLHRQELRQCHVDARVVGSDGSVRWAAIGSNLLVDGHGQVIGTYGTIHDVTARMESERLYRLLADNSNDMIVHFDANGIRRYVSPASSTVLGYPPEELTSQPAAGAIHPEDRASVLATCRTLLNGVENPICSYRQLHKDGRYVWLEASYRLLRDELTGLPDGFIASVRDIGRRTAAELERTQAAAGLESANRLLLMAEEMSAVGHWRVDAASGTAFWSDMVCRIHGRQKGYLPALETAIDAYHPDDRPTVEAMVTAAFATGRSFATGARIVRTDGATRHIIMTGRAENGPDGSVTGLFGVFQDVTDAHQAQQALLTASERLASSNRMLTMAEAVASLGHWRIDSITRQLFWSEETYRIYGIPDGAVPSIEQAWAFYHPDDVDRVRRTIDAALAAGKSYTSRARIVRPDGVARHILTRGEIELGADGKAIGLFGIVQDITDQMAAEVERQAQAEKYFLITEQASDMISLTDVGGVCHFVSPSSKTLLGYEPDELLGKTAYDLAPPEDFPLLAEHGRALARRPAGEVVPLRVRMKRKDGVLLWIDIAARIASDGAEARIISACRDVTSQVVVEEQLRVAQALAEAAATAKSSFLANMSHEIRTPMNGVMGFAELLLASDLDTDQRRQTELIADSSRAMMRLLNDILDLSKVEAGQMTVAAEPFDLVQALTACVRLVTPAVEQKGLDLRCDFAADLPRFVTGDALRIRQIVLNLLGNAAKFTLTGSITLAARMESEGDLAIDVVDTGIGIAADRRQAIFEQFVQADSGIAPRFGGTGLGLSISSGLATLMGGGLDVDSEPGSGTRFTLRLPIDVAQGCPAATSAARAGSMAPSLRDGDVRILVAEDHDVNQLLISAMLEKLGCTPDLAADGIEAIAMVEAAAAAERPYTLVFMDMQMPRLDGVEATRRIRSSGIDDAALPIVALTANAYRDDIDACLAAGMQAHMAKPFSLETLESAVRRWLPRTQVAQPNGAARFSAKVEDRYRARRTETLHRLDRLVRAGTFTDLELEEVATMLHKLAGTAEMFGDVTLGMKARLLETGIETWTAGERRERIVSGVEAIQRAA